jgi:hypothetical protein
MGSAQFFLLLGWLQIGEQTQWLASWERDVCGPNHLWEMWRTLDHRFFYLHSCDVVFSEIHVDLVNEIRW